MKALVTDLDGTLRDPHAGIPAENLAALKDLGLRGVTRIVATGRSLHHAQKVLAPDMPIDWLIFASGAGWKRWPDGEPRTLPGLAATRVEELAGWLDQQGLSYSIHAPAPHSHLFHYRDTGRPGTDFAQRLERNATHGQALPIGPIGCGRLPAGASQFLVFAPPGEEWPRRIAAGAPDLRTLHSTSPLDGRSIWIELQPREISKSLAAQQVVAALGLSAADCHALGNDHNDLDLLEWAGQAAVVANAPEELRRRFPVVAACDQGGLARAVRGWLKRPHG